MKKFVSLVLILVVCFSLGACGIIETFIEVETTTQIVETTVNQIELAKINLVEAYRSCCDVSYASLASDRMSLTVDTNPDDSKYLNTYEDEAILAIIAINSYLEFPSSLIERMSSTRALDGMQTQSYEKYTVTWTYHPDKGLRVIYEVNI